MLELAQERAAADPNGHRIEFQQAGAEQLPVENETADLVLAFDSLDHWQDKAAGLREIRRIL